MTRWIMSANPLVFDHKRAFEENGYIDWNQTRNFCVGDIVYLYCSKTIKKIQFLCVVEKIDIPFRDIVDQSRFWNKHTQEEKKKYVRLRLINYSDKSELTLVELKKNGMQYAPQSPCYMSDELYDYVSVYLGGENES